MHKLYLVLVILLFQQVAFSQTDYTIGTGTTANSATAFPTPFQDYYEGSRAQYLYKASELTAAGMTAGIVTAIKFKVTNLNNFQGTIEEFKVSIGGTAATGLTNTSWETGTIPVFGPVNYIPDTGVNVLNFSTPFFWNGTDNIVVDICNGDSLNGTLTTYSENVSVKWTTGLSFNGSHTYKVDNLGNICGTSNTVNTGAQTTRPNITFRVLGASLNIIHASAFDDYNLNSVKDANEPFVQNAKFRTIKPGVDTIATFTSNGSVYLPVDTGTYFTTAIPVPLYYIAAPASHTTSNFTYNNTDSVLFAFQPKPGVKDLAVQVVAASPARPGFSVQYKLLYQNKGTDTAMNGTVELIKDNRVNYFSATPAPSFMSGDTLRWSFTNLKPLETGSITLNGMVKMPPIVNPGDTLHFFATVSPWANDTTVKDNFYFLNQRVVGSYDPNSKTENHGGKISMAEVNAGDYLTYTIRFQNTGNAAASNVVVRDTLSDKLDWSSFEMLTASANYQLTINDGKCLWGFNNINLIDSIHNEPASHGYLVYRIKPVANVAVGDVITNTASVYFDFNAPVATNTEITNVVATVLPIKMIAFTAKKEGKTNRLQWNTAGEINVDRFEVERSNNGREYAKMQNVKCKMQNSSTYNFIDQSPLTHNYYRLKIIDKDGSFTYSQVVEIIFSISHLPFSISIYPNPAKTQLQVMVESDKKATLQMQVVSQDGKVVLSGNLNVEQGASLRSISVLPLQKGTYFLKITSAEQEQSVVKFEKM